MKRILAFRILIALVLVPATMAQDKTENPSTAAGGSSSNTVVETAARTFDEVADKALGAMKQRAAELDVKGVAVVAYAEGDSTTSWSSKMRVIGALKTAPSQNDRGANLLAIAYSKASEMADTLKASGSGVRPPLTGEVGWQGGVVGRGHAGILIAAFSGGKSEDDVKISKAGLDVLSSRL